MVFDGASSFKVEDWKYIACLSILKLFPLEVIKIVKEVNEAWKLVFQTPIKSRTFGRFSLVNVKVLGTKNQGFNDKTQNHVSQCTFVPPPPTLHCKTTISNSPLNPSLLVPSRIG
jgi:hypothetical protein